MLYPRAGVQLLPMLLAIGCCLWGSDLVENTGKAQILNRSSLRKAALNDSAHCSQKPSDLKISSHNLLSFFLCQNLTYRKTQRCLKKGEKYLSEATEQHLQWGKHHEVRWNVQARKKQMRSKWRIQESLPPLGETLGEIERWRGEPMGKRDCEGKKYGNRGQS